MHVQKSIPFFSFFLSFSLFFNKLYKVFIILLVWLLGSGAGAILVLKIVRFFNDWNNQKPWFSLSSYVKLWKWELFLPTL